jgi:transcriptional regulator with XRE-family HTH domain
MTAIELHPYDVEVGQLLRTVRHAYRVKQQELAERLKLDTATISRYERGERGMNVSLLLTIADLFRIPGSRLLPVQHREAPPLSEPAPLVPQGVPSPPASALSALSEPETHAITTIVNVLATRPDLILGVMDYLEHRDLAATMAASGAEAED